MDDKVRCVHCAHFEKVGGRWVRARCMKKLLTFPARGTSAPEGERIDPETFTCEHAKPKGATI